MKTILNLASNQCIPPNRTSPAYSANSDIQYALDMPGLNILITLKPCNESRAPGQVKDFKLNYDPNSFWRGSLIHRTLGLQRLEYTKANIRSFQHSHLLGVGDMFEVYLRHPEDTARTLPDGPFMFISRENGRIYFYPMGTKEVYYSYGEYMMRHWGEFQREWGKQFNGKWNRVS